MKNKIIAAFMITFISVVFLLGCQGQNGNSGSNASDPAGQTKDPSAFTTVVPDGSKVIEITADGFRPKTLDIKAGDTISFKNTDTEPHWPASGPHPIHNICPGFDAKRPLKTGEIYNFTFPVARQCPFHDHLNFSNPEFQGTINVK